MFDKLLIGIGSTLDSIFKIMGVKTSFKILAENSKTFIKFALVGITGTLLDFIVYKFLINHFSLQPANAKIFSYEVGLINNFIFNNLWTFKERNPEFTFLKRFGMYQLICLGGLIMSYLIIKVLHLLYGDGYILIYNHQLAYNTIYFILTVPPVTAWNFFINHIITWKNKKNLPEI